MISQDESVPQDICSNCEFQIETALLLRKRLQFTEVIWAKYKDRLQDTHSSQQDVNPVLNDTELFLNCHVCGLNFDYHGLQTHIESEHGDGHVSECTFCDTLLDNPLRTPPPVVVPKIEVEAPDIDEEFFEDFDTNDDSSLPFEYDLNCPVCNEVFSRKGNVTRHIERKHKNFNQLIPKRPSKPKLFDIPNTVTYCTICKVQFSRHYNLMRHMLRWHKELKMDQNTDSTVTTSDIQENNEENHPGSLLVQEAAVTAPPNDSTNIVALEEGMELNEIDNKKITCPVCQESFCSVYNVKRHLQRKHKKFNVNEYKVPETSRKVVAQKKIKEERRNAKTAWISDLVVPHEVKDIKKYVTDPKSKSCPICSRKFNCHSSMVLHMKRRHCSGSKDRRAFVASFCVLCNLNFSTPSFFKKHLDKSHSEMTSSEREDMLKPSNPQPDSILDKEKEDQQPQEHNDKDENERRRNCSICHERFWSPYNLQRHILRRHPESFVNTSRPIRNSSIICSKCGEGFSRQYNLQRHMQRKHPECKIYPRSEPREMRKRSTPKPALNIPCQVCEKKFSRTSNYWGHLKMHDGYPCQRCCALLATEQEFADHTEEHQNTYSLPGSEGYLCGSCGKRSSSACESNRHKLDHAINTCLTCSQSFPTADELYTHDLVHNNGAGYPCANCLTKFDTKQELVKHEKKQCGTLCGICGLVVISRFQLHMDKHLGVKPFKCTFAACDKSYHNNWRLKQHFQSHLKQREYVCDFEGCFRSFYVKNALTAHRVTHNEIKRYQCDFEGCTRAFHGRFDLDLHMRRHTGEKPYECTGGCTESFYTRSLLRKHQENCEFAKDDPDIDSECN